MSLITDCSTLNERPLEENGLSSLRYLKRNYLNIPIINGKVAFPNFLLSFVEARNEHDPGL